MKYGFSLSIYILNISFMQVVFFKTGLLGTKKTNKLTLGSLNHGPFVCFGHWFVT